MVKMDILGDELREAGRDVLSWAISQHTLVHKAMRSTPPPAAKYFR